MTGQRQAIFQYALPVSVLAIVLSFPAFINGFPLIFPDTGAYLRIGYGQYFGVERSSGYGLFLKPFLLSTSGTPALWTALAGQLLVIAGMAFVAARQLLRPMTALVALMVAAAFSSWPWHSAQLMPDAFTGTLVLLAWLLSCRELSFLWRVLAGTGAVAIMLMHVTHFAIFAVASMAALGADWLIQRTKEIKVKRLAAPIFLLVLAAGVQVLGNAAYLGRPALAPGGPVFLFARLHEDGLIRLWMARHCGEERIKLLCKTASSFPTDSQRLLWSANSPVEAMIWKNGPASQDRWELVDQMAIANQGAIRERPIEFLALSVRSMGRQFASFQVLDDECPQNCDVKRADVGRALRTYSVDAVDRFGSSRQANAGLPKALARSITTPVTGAAMIALPLVLFLAWRRRDQPILTLVVPVIAVLVANAGLAGALSDVHDRYQSRVAWLAVLTLVIAVFRFRGCRTSECHQPDRPRSP